MNKKFIKQHKAEIFTTMGFIIAVSILGGIYYIKNKNNTPNFINNHSNYKIPDDLLTIDNDGIVNLYTIKSELIDNINLKDYLKIPLEEKKEEKKEDKEEINNDKTPILYKDFIIVKVTIKNNDISWNIQSKLTPNRKVEDMIALDEELNKDSVMHPIYAGDTRLFLKEKDCKDNILGETVIMDTENNKLINKKSIENTTQKKSKDETKIEKKDYSDVKFVYSTSNDISSILVYNNFNNTFMKIFTDKDKIKVESILKTNKYYDIDDFKIENDCIYALSKKNKKVYKFKQDADVIEKDINYPIKDWTIYKDTIYLIGEDKETLDTINMDNKENNITSLNLGDKSSNIEIVNDNLYVLNNFGSKKNNNIVHEFNPTTLASEGWVELNDINNTLIKSANTEKFIVLKQDSIDNNKKNKESLISIDRDKYDKLTKGFITTNSLNTKDAIVKENLLYEKKDNIINLKTISKLKEVGSINIENGTIFVPVFKTS